MRLTVPKELAVDAWFQDKSIRRKKQPGTKLGDTVSPARALLTATVRSVRDGMKIISHSAEVKLRCRRGESCAAPPAKATFNVRVYMSRALTGILRGHPCAEKSRLKLFSRIPQQQRPRGGVNGKSGIIISWNSWLCRHDHIAIGLHISKRCGLCH